MKVYFISGLGADHTAFRALQLPGIEPVHLAWLEPHAREPIEEYAKRMAEKITLPDPCVVGLSFGGMMSIEISKHIPLKKMLLISSAKGRHEIPPYFRLAKYVPLHRMLPLERIATNPRTMRFIFGTRTEEQKKALNAVINNTINGFNAWAIDKVVNWKNTYQPENLFHIHGDADHLLPRRFVKADHIIAGGGHLMVVNQAKEISAVLRMQLLHEEPLGVSH